MTQPVSRREVLTGRVSKQAGPMRYHVSSAVVMVTPAKREIVKTMLADISGVEVAAADASRLVIVIEGSSADELGEKLTSIALMDGVLAANMVFEQAEQL